MLNLCLSLVVSSPSVLAEKILYYDGKVPYIEIRLDCLAKPKIPPLPPNRKSQFIATCRPAREGGCYAGSERRRLQLLQEAARCGFSWIDLEKDVGRPSLPSFVKVIRSYHSIGEFPAALSDLFRELKNQGGDVIKLAVSVSNTVELVCLLRWMETAPRSIPHLIMGMGQYGQPSRFLGGFLGNFWDYVAESEGNIAASGQFTLSQAQQIYRLPYWETIPSLLGVLGNPVIQSLSPVLFNHLFCHYGLNKLYFPFLLDNLGAWFGYLASSQLKFEGFSVILPFKTDAIRFVDTLDSPVEALNTMVKKGSGWEGLCTDYLAFLKPLKSRFSLKGSTAVVLGSGGSAHMVVAALQSEGVRVTVVGKNRDKLAQLAVTYGCGSALFSDLPLSATLCVNTTSVGQYPQLEDSPIREKHLNSEVVYDLVYHPKETLLLRLAGAKGLRTISGMEMFVEQAALQFTAWTTLNPDRGLMKEMIEQELVSKS